MKHGKSKASSAPGRQLAMKRSRDTIWWKAPNYKISVLPVRATAQWYRGTHRGAGKKSSIDKTWNPSPDANFPCLWVQLALGSSSSQKDAVQRGEDIPKAQGLSNFSFCWWASLTKRYSVEISVLMDHRHLIPSARVIIPGYQHSQTPRKSTRVGEKTSHPRGLNFIWCSLDT